MCEVWGYYGLGRSAEAAYRVLSDHASTVPELVARTGKHRATVHRALRRLGEYQLAERVAEGWVRGSKTLEELSQALDSRGRHEARRRQFEHDREVYGRLLETKRES